MYFHAKVYYAPEFPERVDFSSNNSMWWGILDLYHSCSTDTQEHSSCYFAGLCHSCELLHSPNPIDPSSTRWNEFWNMTYCRIFFFFFNNVIYFIQMLATINTPKVQAPFGVSLLHLVLIIQGYNQNYMKYIYNLSTISI